MNIKTANIIIKTVLGIGMGISLVGFLASMYYFPIATVIIVALLALLLIVKKAIETIENEVDDEMDEEEMNEEMDEDPDNLEGLEEKDIKKVGLRWDDSYRDYYVINIKAKSAQFEEQSKWYPPYQPDTLYSCF